MSKFSIKPEMLKYLTESTNKSIEKYQLYYNYNRIFEDPKDKKPNIYILIPFVSFVSFCAGYIFLRKV